MVGMTEPRIQYTTSRDGVSIAYWVMGEGPLLVVPPPAHPWSHIELELQIPEWGHWYEHMARFFRIVRYDARGAGLSDRDVEDISLESHVADLEAVVEAVGAERFALFGFYYSGFTALSYAARHPERLSHLLLWCAFASYETARDQQQAEALRGLAALDWQMFTETLAHTVFGWQEGQQAHRLAEYMRASLTPEMAARSWDESTEFDVRPLLPTIATPTLVIQRRQLAVVPMSAARELAAGLPHAQLVVLEGSSLSPYTGDVNTVVRTMGEFVGVDVEALRQAEHAHERAGAGFRVILFTDIAESTSVTQRMGDEQAQEIIRLHNRVVRESLHVHGGQEVKHTGDGIMASFTSAVLALEAAIAIQRTLAMHAGLNPEQPRFDVRIGMNAGEPVAEGGDLFGTAVQLASRVCANAEPGQILVPDVIRQLVAGKGFLFSDRGDADLRGFDEPVRLFDVRWREDGAGFL
jgi:class 3 adenylate cyclase/pimeloyl-ACP methyl ester carboxylesterase